MKQIILVLLMGSVYAGKSPVYPEKSDNQKAASIQTPLQKRKWKFNGIRTYLEFHRSDPVALLTFSKAASLFRRVLQYSTGHTGIEAILAYHGKISVDFAGPFAEKSCDFLKDRNTQGRIKEICFKGTNNEEVKEILSLHEEGISRLVFEQYDFKDEKITLPQTVQSLFVRNCLNIPSSFYLQISNLVDLRKLEIKEQFSVDRFTGEGVVLPLGLEDLTLHVCSHIVPSFWQQLSSLSQLKSLDLFRTNLEEAVLPHTLKNLYVFWCLNVTEGFWKQLGRLEQLQDLSVLQSHFTSKGAVLSKTLKKLYLGEGSQIHPDFCDQLNRLTQLESLEIEDKDFTYDQVILSRKLTSLNVKRCPNVVSSFWSQLKDLPLKDLSVSRSFMGAALPSTLRNLDLSFCKNIDMPFWTEIAKLNNLRVLNAFGTSFSGTDQLPKTLEYLNIAGCNQIVPTFWRELGALLQLKELHISSKEFTGLDHLKKDIVLSEKLEKLDVTYCSNIAPSFWNQRFKNLKVLSIFGSSFPKDKELRGVHIQ